MLPKSSKIARATGLLIAAAFTVAAAHAVEVSPPVSGGKNGRLAYTSEPNGDRVPDFSAAGYAGGGKPLPDVPVRVTVAPVPGDNGRRIQAAIDYVSGLKPDGEGRRGAVLLLPGRYRIDGQLKIKTSGVVLRGSGAGEDGTILVAAGTDRRALILAAGRTDRAHHGALAHVLAQAPKPNRAGGATSQAQPGVPAPAGSAQEREAADWRVPVGATQLQLAAPPEFKPGDSVLVTRPSPKNWIADVGMNASAGPTPFAWKPGSINLEWDRTVVSVSGNTVTLDAPLTTALESRYGGGTVQAYDWPGRLSEVGVEALRCESEFSAVNPIDEQHAWIAVDLEAAINSWVRDIIGLHFAGSLVQVGAGCKAVTVQDCASAEPVSEVAGYRRNTFHTDGQLVLFLRCRAIDGRNDFTVGYLSAGPNVFLECSAIRSTGFSGSVGSWASGLLFDNVDVDLGSVRFDNLEAWNQGVGWSVANSMIWQSSASRLVVRDAPGAHNWAVGDWGEFIGDGQWARCNAFVKPDSLYRAQLAERLGAGAEGALDPVKASRVSSSVPTLEAAVPDLAARVAPPAPLPGHPLALMSGWLTADSRLMIGKQINTAWWRGFLPPTESAEPGRAITRFVPGRTGTGLTDDLDALTDGMHAAGEVAFRSHWGLWYDERSDDHERTRRPDTEVWPPFYEQPWLRSGEGQAWDRLSRYDLSRYNPWYFGRLRQFAQLGRDKGLILIDEMYFQHNILEAGAHYANFPWRTANNINNPGFPEPPPYKGDKRIFMAKLFYDLSNPVRRSLNAAYIRHCLENLADQPNVIHTTGEEFTGPLSFVQFWLDTAGAWVQETGRHPLLALSAPKDVQDAILADPVRSKLVGVIDLKYWWKSSAGLFAPEGGKDMSPRQSERLWHSRPTALDLAGMAREYRRRFPDKAVIADTDLETGDGWAFAAAGGSLPKLPRSTEPRILAALARMQPVENPSGSAKDQWILAEPGQQYLVYSAAGAVRVDLTGATGNLTVNHISLRDGRVLSQETITGGSIYSVGRAAPEARESSASEQKFTGESGKYSRRGKGGGGKADSGKGGAGRAVVLWITR